MRFTLLTTTACLLLAACSGEDESSATGAVTDLAEKEPVAVDESALPAGEDEMDESPAPGIDPALAYGEVPELPPIDEALLEDAIATLASDAFLGRAPASEGGVMTRDYLARRMEEIGLQPVDGSYEQIVPLVEQTIIPARSRFSVTLPDGETRTLEYKDEAVYWSKRVEEEISFDDSELVFVGYGVVAPEYGWNDYAGIDAEGKTVVMLVNDPGFVRRDMLFNGEAMTYYGRWTYKFEEAARQGATGAVIVHQTAPASYGWGVVEGSWSGPQLDLERQDGGASRAALEGWITEETAEKLFAAAGLDFAELAAAASQKGFEAVDLGDLTASATLVSEIERSESANVVGVLPGQENPDEYVLYTAHWDHLGDAGGPEGEDHIYNGAVDNATGTAALLAIAESFATAAEQPDRSIMFLAVTAEESGLLGSAYYGENPLVPFARTIGGINMDAMTPTGPARDLIVIGDGASQLEDVLESVAEPRGKILRPDANPQAGYFYRSDHISLAKKGVPMLYVDKGVDLLDGGEEAGRAVEADYTAARYHKPGDEYDPQTWRMDGLTDTLTILRDTGAALAYTDTRPNWYEGNEFRGLRDAQLRGE